MSPTIPQVQPLPRTHRRIVFFLAVLLFVVLVPLLVFYAIGYRFDPASGFRNIMSVGGMYINTEAENVAIFINDEPVKDMRIFQRAAYIQNVEAGMHQIHVQGEGVYTWVKQLPVFSHFVTEAASFNMPLVPQFRLIAEYQTPSGLPVVFATNTTPFINGSTTQTFVRASSTLATSTYQINPEHTFIETLFASTTEERALLNEIAAFTNEPFLFSDEVMTVPTTTATTTVLFGDMELRMVGGDVFARWKGDTRRIPYYFCVSQAATSTPFLYGTHVTAQLYAAEPISESELYSPGVFESTDRLCRSEIRIDNKGQTVSSFSFLPGSRDHVLMHLSDGIHVVEIDDRAWQNTQLLYPGENLTLLVNGGKIYVFDGVHYFELFTELQK